MLAGTGVVPAKFAVKPNDAEAPGARTRSQSADFTVASDPAWDSVPFHALLMVSPSASTQLAVQPYSVLVVEFLTVIWPWNPPGQVLVVV
jgi:hypothetical protein